MVPLSKVKVPNQMLLLLLLMLILFNWLLVNWMPKKVRFQRIMTWLLKLFLAFFSGKLKVKGNIMLSQKLGAILKQ